MTMENDKGQPSACAICGKLPAHGRVWVEGEACECYCRTHAARLKDFLSSDNPGKFTLAEYSEQVQRGKQLQ